MMQQTGSRNRRRSAVGPLRWIVAGALVGAATMAGCSSGGTYPVDLGATPTPQPSASPVAFAFAGVWSGPYTVSNGQAGLAQVTIGGDGALSGTVISTSDDDTADDTGTVSGTIDALGNAALTFRSGVLTLNSAGQLTGTVTRFVNGVAAGSATVTLNRGGLTA